MARSIKSQQRRFALGRRRSNNNYQPIPEQEQYFEPKQEFGGSYKKNIHPKTEKQAEYLEALRDYPITLAIGSAGTGKTFLAVCKAYEEYMAKRVKRIILVRPAVATESFGYLPGTLEEKLDPYMKPLWDAFLYRMAPKTLKEKVENGDIEVAPLAYMRGRTFNDAFLILDEAQNATQEQMKLFLSRLGENVKVAIAGDISQSDLKFENGFTWAIGRLRECPSVSTVRFDLDDIVRSDLARQIMKYL